MMTFNEGGFETLPCENTPDLFLVGRVSDEQVMDRTPIYTPNTLQEWVAGLDRRVYAALIGLALGVLGGLIGLSTVVLGPPLTFGAIFGLLAALYILTDVSAALYGVIFVTALLPFGTLPFKIGFTPTFLDLVMGAFLVVYVFQWMTGRRRALQFTPVHALIGLYVMWLLLSFALGLRYASPTSADLRQFAETLLSIGLVFVLVDLLRDPQTLRRLVLVVLAAVGMQAAIALILYFLPDALSENILVRLARIGYPNGGVIRYIEDNPALSERAIGTWVDPNALGGILAVFASMIAPQWFAAKPVLRWRWLTALVLGLVGLALVLTLSRASMLAFGIGLAFIGLHRGYRKYLALIILGVLAVLVLPQTRDFLQHFIDAFTGSDLSTQMRLGEYGDSLKLIGRYPVFGVGFTGTPEIDLYTDVASMYLIMANQIGLIGLSIYLGTMGAVFAYGLRSWRAARNHPLLSSIHLGYQAALLTALINGVADLYFFRTDFQASITIFWLVVALALASSRLALEQESLA
jgi:polysaccharide biosynthesis protein PslJ